VIRLKEKEFAEIVEYMKTNYGINLEKKKVLIECRMTKILEKYELSSFREYLDQMYKDRSGKMQDDMVNRLTTNYTYFLREQEHFDILKQYIFPELFEKRQFKNITIWCAGCSTGEECYTLAMALEEYRGKANLNFHIKILATDISEEVLEQARRAVYPDREWKRIPERWRGKYCQTVDSKNFEIDEKIKYYVHFQKQNLMTPCVKQEQFDLILCRNVMIYFDKVSKEKLIKKLEKSLNPGGYLLIGHAELLSRDETELEAVYPAIYKKTV
jgi:chemotaxis protein methyltransferase CheR